MVKKFGEVREQEEFEGELIKNMVNVGEEITITHVEFEDIEDMGKVAYIKTKEYDQKLRTWSSVLITQLREIQDLLKEYEEPIVVEFTTKAGDQGAYHTFN